MEKKILFSGIKPSGDLTLGNYIGAINSWKNMMEEYECIFAIMNLHAITVPQDSELLKERTLDLLATYIAAGIDPEKCTLFVQSQVPEHVELAWLLTCNSYMGELNRMTQYKDKALMAEKNDEPIGAGLFAYPLLMASDILLYNTEVVPVGQDQKQHVELTRDIATRFNNRFGDTFKVPEPFMPKTGAKVMDLLEPTKKMSKSDQSKSKSENSYILLSDTEEVVTKKIKKAVTDNLGTVAYTDEQPGVKNLLEIYCSLTKKSIDEAVEYFSGKNYGFFKGEVAKAINETLKPIQEEKARLLNNKQYLEEIYSKGAKKASEIATPMLRDVKDKMGIL